MKPCRICQLGWFEEGEDDICDDCKRSVSSTCFHCRKSFYEPDYDAVCPNCGYNCYTETFACHICHTPVPADHGAICDDCDEVPDLGEVDAAVQGALSGGGADDVVEPCPLRPRLKILHVPSDDEWPDDDIAVVAGQWIRLKVVSNTGDSLTHPAWTLGGECVMYYDADKDTGAITALTAQDLRDEAVEFFWIAAGDVTVSVSAYVRGVRCTRTVNVTVLGPTHVSITSVTDQVRVARIDSMLGLRPHLTYGGVARPGILWTCSARVPADGELACTQLMRINRWTNYDDGDPDQINSDAHGVWVLDEVVHYDINPPDGDEIDEEADPIETVEVAANATGTTIHEDSPARPLGRTSQQTNNRPVSSVGYDEAFRVYFMYRPEGEDSIWITLARMDWSYRGEAIYDNQQKPIPWRLQNTANVANPQGQLTHELPVWVKNRSQIMRG